MISTLYRSKTSLMQEWHPKTKVSHYGKDYDVITLETDFASAKQNLFASVGSANSALDREIFVFNKDELKIPYKSYSNDDELDNMEKLDALISDMQALKTAEDPIERIFNIIEIMAYGNNPEYPPVISLSVFKNEGAMACRHLAALLASVLGNLVKAGELPQGSVRIYRDILSKKEGAWFEGGHGWVVYTDFENKKQYLLDPSLKYNLELTYEDELKFAYKIYGRKLIERMQNRIQACDSKLEKAQVPVQPEDVKQRKQLMFKQLNNIDTGAFFLYAHTNANTQASSSRSSAEVNETVNKEEPNSDISKLNM